MLYMKAPGLKGIPRSYPYMVILTHDDSYMLINDKKLATLTTDVTEWLVETFDDDSWDWYHGILSFSNKEDAMGFLLRWD